VIDLDNESAEQQTRFWEKISLIAEIASICRGSIPCANSFDEVLVRIQDVVPFDAATLYLFDEGEKIQSVCAHVGTKIELSQHLLSSSGIDTVLGDVKERLPILICDSKNVSECCPHTDLAELIIAPLQVDGDRIGCLIVGSSYRKVFQDKHRKLLSIVADQLAVSIERQIHAQQIEEKNSQLMSAHTALKEAQTKIVESEALSAVTSLAATINHEINNPLTSIIGNAQFLRMKKSIKKPDLDARLERIEKAALRISETNSKLLKIDTLVSDSHPVLSEGQMLNLGKSTKKSNRD